MKPGSLSSEPVHLLSTQLGAPCTFRRPRLGDHSSRGRRGSWQRGCWGCCCGRILQPKPWYPGVQVGVGFGRDCQGESGSSLGPGSCWVLCATTYPTLFWAPWRSLSIFFQEVCTSIQIIPKCELALRKGIAVGDGRRGN